MTRAVYPCRACDRTFSTRQRLDRHHVCHPIAERLEQAIAYGRSRQWMRTHLDASDDDIAEAYGRIYAANKETG